MLCVSGFSGLLVKISEHSLGVETMELIESCAEDAARVLALDLDTLTSSEIVAAVDNRVHELQQGDCPDVLDDNDPAFLFGSLWGQQLVRDLGWHWAGVTFHDHNDTKAIGVFSPDRSLAVYPFHFVWGCLENHAPVTIMLAFNLLKDGSRIPQLPARGYENVMDNVHHIVPRD